MNKLGKCRYNSKSTNYRKVHYHIIRITAGLREPCLWMWSLTGIKIKEWRARRKITISFKEPRLISTSCKIRMTNYSLHPLPYLIHQAIINKIQIRINTECYKIKIMHSQTKTIKCSFKITKPLIIKTKMVNMAWRRKMMSSTWVIEQNRILWTIKGKNIWQTSNIEAHSGLEYLKH